MEPAYVYRARLLRVVDGDTLHLDIDLGFRVHAQLAIRLHGVNTPELDTPEGKAARYWLIARLSGHDDLVVQSYRDRQSFARWVADVWLDDGESLAEAIIAAGHGVAYMV